MINHYIVLLIFFSLLFWSDVGSVFGPKIECSNLNGQNRVILTRDVTAVMALSIDHVTDRLYWVDSVRQTLESMPLGWQQQANICGWN